MFSISNCQTFATLLRGGLCEAWGAQDNMATGACLVPMVVLCPSTLSARFVPTDLPIHVILEQMYEPLYGGWAYERVFLA